MTDADTLARDIVEGRVVTPEQANDLARGDYAPLLYHAGRIRHHFKGNRINLCSIVNAKSGACSEDCRFCAQSRHYPTTAVRYPFVGEREIKKALSRATNDGAGCFGIVTSGRRLSKADVARVSATVATMKNPGIRISASLGELDEASLRQLKNAGLTRFHHNLETAESFFPRICSTHAFKDRLKTVRAAKKAGLEVCCGGLFGLGETLAQRLELAFTLRDLDVDSIPLNFLNPIAGTPLAHQARLSPREILKTVALFRFILPEKDISVCGGREVNLRDLQSWIFYAGANGMMVGGYLTTRGRPVEQDRQMIEDLGLEISGE